MTGIERHAKRGTSSQSPWGTMPAGSATLITLALVTAAVIGLVPPSAALAGPTWDGGGGANSTWSTATNWNLDAAPNLSNGTSAIVFATLGSGTAAAATSLGGGLVDILSLRSDVVTGTTVTIGSTGTNVVGLSINSGTLVVRSGSITKANGAAVVINSTLQLQSDGFFSSTNQSNIGLIIAGPIIQDGTSRNVVINASSGRVALGGTSTYTGSTTVERGTLLVGLSVSGSAANAGVSAAPGVAGALGNATSEVLVGNANTLANNWNVELEIGAGASMSRSIRFANAGNGTATLLTRGAAAVRSGTITLDRVIAWNHEAPAGSWAGLVTGTGGFAKGGGGPLRLTNTANNFTGPVSVVNTDLQFDVSGSANALGTGTSVIQAVETGVTSNRIISAFGSGTFSRGFNVVAPATHTVTINTGDAGDVEFAGDTTLNSLGANVTLGAANQGTARWTGVISGSAPVLIFGGASSNGNKILLSNTSNSFTGQVRVATAGLFVGGNAPAGAVGVLGNATSAVVVGAQTSGVNPSYLVTDGAFTVGRDLVIAGPSNGSADAFTGDVMIGGATAQASVFSGGLAINRTAGIGTNFLFATTGGSVEFSGAISGSAAIKIGGGSGTRTGLGGSSFRTGDVILSGNNSGFSGAISVSTLSRLVVASNNALGTGTGTISLYDSTAVTSGTGGVSTRGAVTVSRNFQLDGTATNPNQAVSFEGTTADPSVFTGSITITRILARTNAFAAVAGGSVDFQGAITGTGAAGLNITKNGAGLVIFSATNNYQGSTTINAGVLRGTDGVGISGSNVLMAGGVWESAGNITRGLGTGAGQMQVTNANSGSSGFSSANAGGMVVAIGGTAAPTALTWGATNFTMNSLILNDTTATGPLTFSNAINLGAGNRTIVVAANVATVSGSLSGASGGLVKQGAGTLVLAGSNSYGGTTAINAGRLQVGDGGTTGSLNNGSPVSVASGAALAFNRSNDLTYSGTVSGAGGLQKLGGGKLTLTSAQTFTGDTVVSAGTLALGSGATLASSFIEVGETAGSGAVLDIGALGAALNIGAGKTLGGYGTVTGTAVVIANTGIISPGGSVGGITIGALEFGKDGVYTFEVNDATGSAGGLLGNGWDLVTVSSAFTLSADSFDPFIINLVSLSGAVSGLAANFDGTSGNYQWKFLDANAPITNYSANKFLLNVGGFLNPTAGSFSIAQGGIGGLGGSTTSNELYVVYVSVPEPGTLTLAALGIGGVAVLACRRRRR